MAIMRGRLLAIPLVVVVLSSCVSDRSSGAKDPDAGALAPSECASGTISGAGTTFALPLIQRWTKDFVAKCPGATVNYQPVDNGLGAERFISGHLDFGATDAPMNAEEEQAAKAKGGAVIHIPWATGGVAVMYNLPIPDLTLSPETLAGIYAGRITTWQDPRVAADNAGVNLPATDIQVIYRSDGSGVTEVFTSYLNALAPSIWTARAGRSVSWPAGRGAEGSDGVAAAVKQTTGAIGYGEAFLALANGLGVAGIKTAEGMVSKPTWDAVAAAVLEAKVPADLKVEIPHVLADPFAYPISMTGWALVFAKPGDAAKARLLKAFLLHALGEGQDHAIGFSYGPLPLAIDDLVRAAARSIGT